MGLGALGQSTVWFLGLVRAGGPLTSSMPLSLIWNSSFAWGQSPASVWKCSLSISVALTILWGSSPVSWVPSDEAWLGLPCDDSLT
ncbi:MAG: hypothetical protein OXE59_02470 [Bacteroidetes bacterium]|nr:hypothetical protein [Bacteroidota bacterium]